MVTSNLAVCARVQSSIRPQGYFDGYKADGIADFEHAFMQGNES